MSMKAYLRQSLSRGGLPTPDLLLAVPSIGQELSEESRLLHLKGLQRLSIRHGDANYQQSGRRWHSISATAQTALYG